MENETAAALKEIAELLRKRVEQEDAVAGRAIESSQRAAEMTARMKASAESVRNVVKEAGIPPVPGKWEDMRADIERRREEERQFRQRLIAELERHNALLTDILERLKGSAIL